MRIKIGRVIIQLQRALLSENYKPITGNERELIVWLKSVIESGNCEIIKDDNIDVKKMVDAKRKKTLENIIKVSNFIDKKYYVNNKPISFVEISYKTGLSISTIKRYLKNILKDKEIVTITKDELVEKIKAQIL